MMIIISSRGSGPATGELVVNKVFFCKGFEFEIQFFLFIYPLINNITSNLTSWAEHMVD